MNRKITLPVLTHLLALRTGDTKKQSEDFLKEFFGAISAALTRGEQVKIKDLGVFKTIEVEARKSVNVSTGEDNEIPAHRKVVFVPAKELAALINEPFSMFETEEIVDDSVFDDSISDDSMSCDSISDDSMSGDSIETDELSESDFMSETIEQQTEDKKNLSAEDETFTGEEDIEASGESFNSSLDIATEEVTTLSADTIEEFVEETPHENIEENSIYTYQETTFDSESADFSDNFENNVGDINSEIENEFPLSPNREERPIIVKKTRFWLGFIIGFLMAALCAAGALILFGNHWPFSGTLTGLEQEVSTDKSEDEVPNIPVEESAAPESDSTYSGDYRQSEMSDDAPTAPSDAPVYDYISKTRFLTTMAKDHYGNYHLWPYIYEENKAFLGHPDRIKIGTRIVIPDLKKYGVDPHNSADIERAKAKGVEIYSRYK